MSSRGPARHNFTAITHPALPPFVTWDNTHAVSTSLFLNNNLTFEAPASGVFFSCIATARLPASDSIFWTQKLDLFTAAEDSAVGISGNIWSGVVSSGNSWIGNTSTSCGFFDDATIWINNVKVSSAGITYTTGDQVDMAANTSLQKVWGRVNGGSWLPTGDPVAGTGGQDISAVITAATIIYPACTVAFAASKQGQFTGNFGATTFPFSAPTGYRTLP